MRMHLLGLPNAPVHPAYELDGFAQATHRFCYMMHSLGHEIFLYGAEGSNIQWCKEFIQTISEKKRLELLGNTEYQNVIFDGNLPLWQWSNIAAAAEIAARKESRDLLLTIGGYAQKQVFDYNPELLGVEYSIGYAGNFAQHRVFESHAWRHYCYGQQKIDDGRFYDHVIPLFFDPDEFPVKGSHEIEDYFLYVGRLTPRKGLGIACEAARKAGVKLKVIGHGDASLVTGGAEYVGAVSRRERNELMSKARAVICPTVFIEPFNAVAVEAQLCGTPVITTDFGGFTETVEQGETGFRCTYLGEFVSALKLIHTLNRSYVRARAVRNYSMHELRHDYDTYFQRLMTRWGEGWNTVD